MISKNEIKFIQSLSNKKQRAEAKLFVVEGVKLLQELIQSSYQIKKIYATPEWNAQILGNKDLLTVISEQELERISSLQTPNQVLALVHEKEMNEPINFAKTITLMLDDIQDPGNLGTIIRNADWFGIHQIVCSPNTVSIYNNKVLQSTMGSFTRVNVYYQDLIETVKNAHVPIIGAILAGENIYHFQKPTEGILVIGNEGKGIHEELLTYIKHPVTIPKIGAAESLNAAVATGIILSHIVGK